jgi:hypothetical protein
MYWLANLLVVLVVLGITLYYVRGPLLGFLVTALVKVALRKKCKDFHLGSFSLLPFAMLEFRTTVCATRKSPEGSVSWRSFKILFDITKMFDPLLSLLHVLPVDTDDMLPKRGRMLQFVFEGFSASSPGLTYALFLDPPENKLPPVDGSTINADGDKVLPEKYDGSVSYGLVFKRLMQHIVLFVDIIFDDFSFNFTFPTHQSHMIGSARLMTISFPRPADGVSDTVSVLNRIDDGVMEIFQDAERAVYYVGKQAKMSMDVHLPSGVMEVLMRIIGRDHDQMYVTITPFLDFYRTYANAEDNSIEIRMARGLSTGGKMAMRLECEYINVHVTDARCRDPLHMTLQELEGELRTYFLTRNNERMYKDKKHLEPLEDAVTPRSPATDGDLSSPEAARQTMFQYFMRGKASGPVVMSPNKDKVMKGGVKRIDFHTHRTDTVAYVEEVSGIKIKRVFNENDFIDNDRMSGYAKAIHFEKIHPELLDWLLVLQDTSNKLPDSRFSHMKNSEMYFHGDTVLFSTQPVSSAYVPPPLAPLAGSTKSHEQQQPAEADHDPPLDTLEHIPVDPDHWVCFRLRNMVAKRELPHNEVDILIDIRSDKFTVRTSLPQTALSHMYALDAVGDYDVVDSDDDSSSTSAEQRIEEADSESSSSAAEGEEVHYFDTDGDLSDVYGEPEGGAIGGSMLRLRHPDKQESSDTGTSAGPVEMSLDSPPLRTVKLRTRGDHSRAFTGTYWTFPNFSVRMKLGVKMNMEWVRADVMKIEFLNSPHDILKSVQRLHSIDKHPFFLSSTLSALWHGPSVTCDFGAVQVKASVAGLIKTLAGYAMIRKTLDRGTARMANMKVRGMREQDLLLRKAAIAVVNAETPQAPPHPTSTIRMDTLDMDIPLEISQEDHDKRLQHELVREQEQILREHRLAEKLRGSRKNTMSSDHSDAQDAAHPLNLSIEVPDLNPLGADRADKSLRFHMTAFEYSSCVGESTGEFATARMALNSYPERPWMVMGGVRYHRAIVPLSTDDAFYQGLDIQSSMEAAHITTKSAMELSMESFDMFYSVRMEFGLVAEALLAQDAAYKLATRPLPRRRWKGEELHMYAAEGFPEGDEGAHRSHADLADEYFGQTPAEFAESAESTDDSYARGSGSLIGSPSPIGRQVSASTADTFTPFQPREDWQPPASNDEGESEEQDTEEKIVPNPNTMHVMFKSFTVTYDAHYRGDYLTEFMTAEFIGFDLFLDATKYPTAVQDEITALDIGTDGAEDDLRKLQQLQQQHSSQLSPGKSGKQSANNLSQRSMATENEDLLLYSGVFGGQLKFTTKFLVVKLKPFKDPFVKAENMSFAGPIYNASVKDDRILKCHVAVALSDSVPCYVVEEPEQPTPSDNLQYSPVTPVTPVTRNYLPAAVVGATEPLYVTLLRSSAPPKIYMDLTLSGTSLELGMSHSTMDCIMAVNAVTECVVPPNKDGSPLLVFWDLWRFLLHGCFSFSFDKLTLQYNAMDYMTQKVKLNVKADKLKWYMDKGTFSMTAQNLAVEAELNTTVLAGRRGHGKRSTGGSQPVVVTRMCTIPAVVLSLTHFRSDVRDKFASQPDASVDTGQQPPSPLPSVSQRSLHSLTAAHSSATRPYSHHDVYLRPALADSAQLAGNLDTQLEEYEYINHDRYHHFRSHTMSVRWEVELRMADDHDIPISFNLRLDHMVRILDALKPAEESEDDTQQRDVHDELRACLDKPSEYNYGVVRHPAPMSLGDLISSLKLQLILNRIMISSWPSATNLGGVVMTIASSELQLRMLRDIPVELLTPPSVGAEGKKASDGRKSISSLNSHDSWRHGGADAVFPLVIDHLYMDTAFVELYVRNWNMKSNGTVVDASPRASIVARSSLGGTAQHLQHHLLRSISFFPYCNHTPGSPRGMANVQEPGNHDEMQGLFLPIFKTAHSTKMVISLTESGVVCSRDAVFTHSGILDKVSERAQKTAGNLGSSRNRSSRRIPSNTALNALEGQAVVFLIGKDWKAYLARAASASNASSSSTSWKVTGSPAHAGRRPSALTLQLAEGKVQVRHDQHRRRTMLYAGDVNAQRRSSVGRRTSVTPGTARARHRPRSESVNSNGSESSQHGLVHYASRASMQRPRRSSLRGYRPERALSLRASVWDPLVDGYRASLLSFKTNHAAFTPPPEALPASYAATQTGFVKGQSAHRSEEDSSFGAKIWGLRITDLRLLFTIQIRDVLFNYVARGMDLFQSAAEGNPDKPGGSSRRRTTSVETRREQKAKREAAKATVHDFLQPTSKEAQHVKHRREKRAAAEEKGKFGFNPPNLSPLQTQLPASSDPMLQFLTTHLSRPATPVSNREAVHMMKLGAAPLTPGNRHKFQRGGRQLTRENNQPIVFNFEETEEGISAKDALEAESDSDEEYKFSKRPPQERPFTPSVTTRPFQSTTAATAPLSATSRSATPLRIRPPVSSPVPANRPVSGIAGRRSPSSFGSPTPSAAPSTRQSKAPARAALSEYFFIVELIDPQVNFLDVNTHSSLIIVAGLSSLEGRRYTDATLPPSSSSGAAGPTTRDSFAGGPAPRTSLTPTQLVPKRQQELRLRMDGVSAFTVPSNSPEAGLENTDVVHWKHMENTEVANAGDLGYLGRRRGVVTTESPFMRMAIKDFQIRALYIFWTDVTVKEAKSMYLLPSKEDLVCTFKLELPVICVDILSWQFYVIMHVVRNVLLVPPPASARKNTTQSEMEEAEKNKVLELMRDPVLLAKHDVRANLNAPLDLKYKVSRDELKLLIEENLAGAMMHMELGSARFVEVFVGSCTWILRMNSSAATAAATSSTTALVNPSGGARDYEKEQLKVEITGFHATFAYGEDRYALYLHVGSSIAKLTVRHVYLPQSTLL